MNSLDGKRVLNFWEAFNEVEPFGLAAQDQLQKIQTAAICTFLQSPESASGVLDPDLFAAFPQLQPQVNQADAREAEIDQFRN